MDEMLRGIEGTKVAEAARTRVFQDAAKRDSTVVVLTFE